MAAVSPSFRGGGPPALRPLSIGELFDRASTIYFRHIVTFLALLLVVVAPLALLQFMQLGLTHNVLDAYFSIFDQAIKHPSTPPDLTKLDEAISNQSPFRELGAFVLAGLTYLFSFLALPLANAAVVSGVSRAYLGLPVRFKVCYQNAFRRWGYTLLLLLLWLIVAIPAVFVAFFGFVVAMVLLAALGTALHTFGIVVGAIFGIALFLAIVGVFVMAYMAFAASFIACVLENVDPIRAFGLGWSRIFGGGLFMRSLFIALWISWVFIVVGAIAGALDIAVILLTHSWFLYVAVAHLLNVLYVTFAFVLVAVYYYDIRVRREGFDLQLLADQISATDAQRAAEQQPAAAAPTTTTQP